MDSYEIIHINASFLGLFPILIVNVLVIILKLISKLEIVHIVSVLN